LDQAPGKKDRDQTVAADTQSPATPERGDDAMARSRANANGGGRTNKRQAVRDAMDVLGMDASPGDIHDHLKKAGLDLSTNMISSYKSQIRSKAGLKGRRRRRKGGRRPQAEAAAPAAPRAAGDGISIKDLRTLREMAERLGAHRFKELLEVLYQ
jgi:hypothetical protein